MFLATRHKVTFNSYTISPTPRVFLSTNPYGRSSSRVIVVVHVHSSIPLSLSLSLSLSLFLSPLLRPFSVVALIWDMKTAQFFWTFISIHFPHHHMYTHVYVQVYRWQVLHTSPQRFCIATSSSNSLKNSRSLIQHPTGCYVGLKYPLSLPVQLYFNSQLQKIYKFSIAEKCLNIKRQILIIIETLIYFIFEATFLRKIPGNEWMNDLRWINYKNNCPILLKVSDMTVR